MRNSFNRAAMATGAVLAAAIVTLGAQALGDTNARQPATVSPATLPSSVQLPGTDPIPVMILSDIGSRNSKQGDTFAVVTTDDYVVDGKLVLPKGSPGYGLITDIQRSGTGKKNGQLSFTITKLVAPGGADVATQMTGSTSDAVIHYERNGSDTMQVLLWGVFAAAKRGDDLQIKAGETFHITANGGQLVPAVAAGTAPSALNTAQLSIAPAPQFSASVNSPGPVGLSASK
ncbi:MAG: hypothetical protein JO293_02855 [Candidatus Eremiobacteraeota bacterium]|nr:hypothetical protein [Candidatus Eremiobacteraeota bacterium]MBV8222274.1 hypothetical protein [Candidatus Eremiobacteraeota bacterium]